LIRKRDREEVVTIIDGDVLSPSATKEHEEVGVGFSGGLVDTLLLQSYTDHMLVDYGRNRIKGN